MTAATASTDRKRMVPSRRRRSSRSAAEARAGIALSVPFLVLFGVFTAWPLAQSLFMSFTDMTIRDMQTPFSVNPVGLDNYAKAVADRSSSRAR